MEPKSRPKSREQRRITADKLSKSPPNPETYSEINLQENGIHTDQQPVHNEPKSVEVEIDLFAEAEEAVVDVDEVLFPSSVSEIVDINNCTNPGAAGHVKPVDDDFDIFL